MGYTKRIHQRIAVPYSGSVRYSYPASQSGGSGYENYSGTAYEDVEVEVYVDTDPFEEGVESCNHHVDGLTTSVVATEAAEIKSIKHCSEKVGNQIVEGFFSTVQFEISSQIVELSKRVDALLVDLKEKGDRIKALQSQMNLDYQRTCSRYAKIFDELNKELDNRVHALDQPVFTAINHINSTEDRLLLGDDVNIVSLAAKENGILDAQISVALAKKHAHAALREANLFLSKKQGTEDTIRRATINDCADRKFFAPVCCMKANNEKNVYDKHTYASEILPKNSIDLVNNADDLENLYEGDAQEKSQVDRYFQEMLVNRNSNDNSHDKRVMAQLAKLYSSNPL